MAYVGTPRYLGNELQTLASIIQGEAGGEGLRGMQAVADVIRNRASKNFSGYGNGLLDQALARNQFQGQSAKAGPEAIAVAQQLQSGTLPDAAGNAVYYANPGASTASWARRLNANNALKIGNHYFTDNADGVPFSAPSLPGKIGGDSMVARNFDPQVAAATNTPSIFGSIAPTQTADAGTDPIAAKYAFGEKKTLGDRLGKLGQAFDDAIPSIPRPSAFPGGPSKEQANAIMAVLKNPAAFSQMLLGKRMA